MAESILVTGKKISSMELVTNVQGNEKIPTGQPEDLAITPNQIKDFIIERAGLVNQTELETEVSQLQTSITNTINQSKNYTDTKVGVVGAALEEHVSDQTNPHQVTKEQVGLGEVDNTSDVDKPVSNATKILVDNNLNHIKENGAALPFSSDVTYVEGSVVLKDGQLVQKSGDNWVLIKTRNASELQTASSQTQQEVNDSVGAKWYSKEGGYPLHARIMLDNGDIVRNIVPNNTNDPNNDMTGWVKDSFKNVEYFGARAESGFDNSEAIELALNSDFNIEFKEGEVYEVNRQISVKLINKKIAGNGATLKFVENVNSTNGEISCVYISYSRKSVIDNLNVHIVNKSLAKQYSGFKISNSRNLELYSCDVTYAGWSGISIFDSLENTSKKISIIGGKYEYCRFGIYSNGEGTIIKDNYVSSHWSESSEATSQGALPIWSDTPVDSEYYDGIIIKGTNWVISGNTIEDNGQSGIYSGACKLGTISNNTIKGNWNKGIDFGASRVDGISTISNINVVGNTVIDNKTGQVHLYKTDFCVVSQNRVSVIDTSYDSYSLYKQPCILLNSDNFHNIVSENTIVQSFNDVVAIFANKAGDKSTDNYFINNDIMANINFNINFDDNYVDVFNKGTKQFLSDVQFNRRVTNRIDIDLSVNDLTGFDGRNALNLKPSDDNSYVQITASKEVRILKPDGTGQNVQTGKVTATELSISGLSFFGDSSAIRLPRSAQTNTGYLWFDSATGTLKYTSASGVVKTITAT